MSSPTDAEDSVSSNKTTITYKTVASIEKFHAVHDITIRDFQEWRNNVELLGPIKSTFVIPMTNKEVLVRKECTYYPNNEDQSLRLVWIIDIDKESGDLSFYITNMSATKISIIVNLTLRNKNHLNIISTRHVMKRVFEATTSWGYDGFMKKDMLDNKKVMDDILDENGHLGMELRISCKSSIIIIGYFI